MTALAPFTGDHRGQPVAINAYGQVVGNSVNDYELVHSFLYSNGTMTFLGTLPGDITSTATAINNSGQVVGSSGAGDVTRGFLYSRGNMTELGSLPGTPSSECYCSSYTVASTINDSGQVVGNSNGRPFLYTTASGMIDLNTMLPSGSGWTLDASPLFLNNQGQIAGAGTTPSGESHAFLLSPSK